MKEHKICFINALITGIIGILLMNLLVLLMGAFGSSSNNIVFAHLITLLLLPMAYITTKLFIRLNIRNAFLGFIVGGIFASINGVIMGLLILLLLDRMREIAAIFVLIPAFGLVIGGVAGAVISSLIKES